MTVLVDYSDSDGDENNLGTSTVPQSCCPTALPIPDLERVRSIPCAIGALPPLPLDFHDLYTSATRASTIDDPSLHGGRKRRRPHIEGEWPTHVYLEWHPRNTELRLLNQLLEPIIKTNPNITSLLASDLGSPLPLHISLSKPISLLSLQRGPFLELFAKLLDRAAICPFVTSVTNLRSVSNDEATRWFLVLQMTQPAKQPLNELLMVTNTVAQTFGESPLYATGPPHGRSTNRIQGRSDKLGYTERGTLSDNSPGDLSECFHISIAWCLDRPNTTTKTLIDPPGLQELRQVAINFGSAKIKVGNVVHNFPFTNKTFEQDSGVIKGAGH